MRVILTGGGTGGHIYPALAIAAELRQRDQDVELLYVGTAKGLESRIVPDSDIAFKSIDISGIDRSSMLKASKSMIKFPASFFQARTIIKEFQPDIIVGTGGYVSFPIVLAGTFFDVKTIIHEQNAFPGLANRNLAKRVDRVLLTFAEAASYLPAHNLKVTGLPVRKKIMTVDKEKARINLGLNKNLFTMVAFGGSLGAMTINRAMLDYLDLSRNEELQIVWITGESAYEEIQAELERRFDRSKMRVRLTMFPYMYNIEEALAVADLAVCRAGAGTVCELSILGLPAILVPYPYAADNHQEKNARALVDKNAALMVIDEFFDGYTLYQKIQELKNNPQLLNQMGKNIHKEAKPDALNAIVDEIISLASS
ncbi:N-acetylglucosaminyltransferase, MurG [Syntrophomonas zehnderi OL-4]|uniref:UDP-N-acetylglucosamine--N-acetylmuramyl-(pentapeptide) pyrophosphoryl-undecaprenol N-acetylglucosamine transferase n=1 Tax=Syntrophomonas zehnderi OL-4 TaxID=690567 RepID=A0A0E4C8Q8_9FIRM|nr:N-acetylglucosaminyltransferase, MurG [Syntrophomonas zehnderi OL-4]